MRRDTGHGADAVAELLALLGLRKIFFVVALGGIMAMGMAGCTKGARGVELALQPEQALIGDPVNIRATGLDAAQAASLEVSGKDQFGNTWSSSASFRADSAGTIDTSRDAPIDGSYKGVDQAGLFWSMAAHPISDTVSPFAIMPTQTVSLSVGGQQKATQTLSRLADIDLEIETLTDPIVGAFIKPQEITEATPALIVLGGSEGGYNEGWARVIASKTRMPTLALAYFGAPGLPPILENIPLETVKKGIDWLNGQSFVAKDRIGVIGASRGGELAILAASLFPEIKAVVGYTPSGLIWSGLGETPAPAWTYEGRAFPYLVMMDNEEQQKRFADAQKSGTPYLDAPSFAYSLEQQQSLIAEATIQAEKSDAAFLLIGNPGDGVWPSDRLSQFTIDRLRANNYSRGYQLLSYEQGGHMLIAYPYFPTTMRQFYLPTINIWEGLGGTVEGAAKAAEDSWPKAAEFLGKELRAG